MNPLIKICGMREAGNILAAAELRPDIMGFIFYPGSHRYAGEMLNPGILLSLPHDIRKAGVFVNAGYHDIKEIVRMYSLDMVQLHGTEKPDLCCRLKDDGIEVIKAFNLKDKEGFLPCSAFKGCTDYFLFDAVTSGFGGSGNKFNWEILGSYDLGQPFFLSGGIAPSDSAEIRSIDNASFYAVDLNSRFEIKPGVKDTDKLKRFIEEIRF